MTLGPLRLVWDPNRLGIGPCLYFDPDGGVYLEIVLVSLVIELDVIPPTL